MLFMILNFLNTGEVKHTYSHPISMLEVPQALLIASPIVMMIAIIIASSPVPLFSRTGRHTVHSSAKKEGLGTIKAIVMISLMIF